MKLPLRSLSCLLMPALLVGVCACSAAAAGGASNARMSATESSQPSTGGEALLSFAKEIGVSCQREEGRLACIGGRPEVGDYYDVDLHPGCGANAMFGAVIAPKGTDLRDRIAPIDRRTTARFTQGQLLCIEAIGWAGKHASYYYVRQVPASSVGACESNPTCRGYGDRPVRFTIKPPGSCAVSPEGQPTTSCAAGWIRGDDATRIVAGN